MTVTKSANRIVVTGATGGLGRAIALNLISRIPADQVGVSVRDVDKAADLTALGVQVRRGDFSDPRSLQHAFEGVTQLLMVSSNARAYGGDPLAQHRTAIEAAREAGVRSGRAAHRLHQPHGGAGGFVLRSGG